MYYVYILLCADGSYYTGVTNHLEKRLQAHKEGTGARYTRARGAIRFVYSRRCRNRSYAQKRESAIKKMSRSQKEILIQSEK
jgi:putative endonuclease